MRPYLAQIKSTLRLMARDRAVLFFNYLFPLMFFFTFAQAFGAGKNPAVMSGVIATVIIIGVLSNGFFGAGLRTIQDREANVLRRFKVAPINASPIIVATLVSGLASFLPTVFLFLFFGRTIYHAPLPANLGSLVLFVCFGIIAFRSLGMIIASVVNSAPEGQILTNLLYLPMLFLSTFPVSIMPSWIRTISQFMPATYLFQGIQSITIGGETIFANASAVFALVLTTIVSVFVSVKIFRWEKEEKIAPSGKLWVLAVLSPFFILGIYQASTKQNIQKQKLLAREAERSRSILFQNVRIFTGDGTVIPNGAVLIRNGKISEVFSNPVGNTQPLHAEVWDEAGRTLMPGLIDMHVHIGAPGGIYRDYSKYMHPHAEERRLAAYLYCGITAVRSTGDLLENTLKLRQEIKSGEYLGAELFSYGPLFTAPGGHPTELLQMFPEQMRKTAQEQFVRLPKDPAEARQQVDALKQAGVDGIKAVLESGSAQWQLFNLLDTKIYRAIVAEAIKNSLPTATHTGSAADVNEAVDADTNTIEHGSMVDLVAASTFAAMKEKRIAYDPTLSVLEAIGAGAELLDRPLLQRVGPADLLSDTRSVLQQRKPTAKSGHTTALLERGNRNLLAACNAGVPLIAGSDAGNMLVVHGPTVQHELELWVKAGIPPAVTLRAATSNAAKYLRADQRIGLIRKGYDATLILLDGDPVQDITATERIANVFFKGEDVRRPDLFKQDTE
ncbi:MAG: amidohydrolase family protein [Acidobacteriaceae bacterium]|nr:amidohydrolase family protein [Acidobacteriaceae bacterium]